MFFRVDFNVLGILDGVLGILEGVLELLVSIIELCKVTFICF
jgi:hypothetical protein